MKAVFEPLTAFLGNLAFLSTLGSPEGFTPVPAGFTTNKTAKANGEGGHSKTCNLEPFNHSFVSPCTPSNGDSYRSGGCLPKFCSLSFVNFASEGLNPFISKV
jgi:hypothetical protein